MSKFSVGDVVQWSARDKDDPYFKTHPVYFEGTIVKVVPDGVVPIGCYDDLGYTGVTYIVSRINTLGRTSRYWYDEERLFSTKKPSDIDSLELQA